MSTLPHPLLAILATAALLAGCAGQPGRTHSRGLTSGDLPTPPPGHTGIARCDDYLANYRACHRAAGIFTPGELEGHYQAMRRSLLEEARDPAVQPQLAARCDVLVRNQREALHGRPCAMPDAPATTTSLPAR